MQHCDCRLHTNPLTDVPFILSTVDVTLRWETAMEKSKKRADQLTKIVRVEIVTAVSRTSRPPKMRDRDAPPVPTLAPFTDQDAWIPTVKRKNDKTGKWHEVSPHSPRVACFELLRRCQRRLRHAGNAAMIELFRSARLPLGEMVDTIGKDGKPNKRRVVENGKTRNTFDTVAYQTICEEWPSDDLPNVSARVCSALARRIQVMFKKWLKSDNRDRISTVTDGWPIPIRADAWCFTREDGLNLAFNLDGTWWELGLRIPRKNLKAPANPYVMRTLARIAAGESSRGNPSAVPNSRVWIPGEVGFQFRGGKWYALIQYRQPKPKRVVDQNHMIVHCGLRNFVLAVTLDEALQRRHGIVDDGLDLIRQKYVFRLRRREIQRARKFRKHGHGHAHQKAKLSLDDRDRRWTDNWLRRRAARIVNKAVATKSVIHMMDLKNIRTRAQHSDLPGQVKVRVHQAPWYRFGDYIKQRAAASGLEVHEFEARYHTVRCPKCGKKDKTAPNYGPAWRYTCTECGYTNDIDRTAVDNAFVDFGLMQQEQVGGSEQSSGDSPRAQKNQQVTAKRRKATQRRSKASLKT